MRLATKITLPFLALFAFLLIVLGYVLAHQILTEVERRVENEHRFVLEVATFPGFVFSAETLRQIRDRATRSGESGAAGRGEFIVLQGSQTPISTLDTPGAKPLIDALRDAERAGVFQDADDTIRVSTQSLNNSTWLVLYTARGARGVGATGRRTFLIYPYEEIRRVQNEALYRILGLGGLGIALASGLGLLIAQWISSPIRTLAATAARVQSTGLQPVDEKNPQPAPALDTQRDDEIGELSRSFQGMLESLRSSQSELLRSERLASAGKIAASVAHEIRNPLTSLRMMLQMLQQKAAKADSSDQQAYVIILGEIDRLSLAVEDLLTVARPKPAQRVPTDLSALVESTLKFMERQLGHARITAKMEFDASLPTDLQLDPNKLRQVLVNLILNALQAMVREGTVTLRTRWLASERVAVLEVSDTGPGIPEEVRNNVFDLFVSTKTGGGGLGLAIAKQIAEEHGGTIAFETSKSGTTFTLRLPQ